MLTAVYAVFVFCLIIFIHEFGHFITAKLTGMTVHEFSIGMGTKLLSFKTVNTEYSLRLLPIGGYVKLEGEDQLSDDKNAFCNKSPFQRILVLFFGAFMNFLLGFAIFIFLFSLSGGITTNKIGDIINGSSFETNGVLSGDRIIAMETDKNSSSVHDYNDISFFISRNGSENITFTFKRGDDVFKKQISPSIIEGYDGKIFGFRPQTEKPGFVNVVSASYRQSIFVIKVVLVSFADLFKGAVSLKNMSGPVGIVNEIGNAAEAGKQEGALVGLMNVLSLCALISINLGVVNLLPFPALDGGRILFIIIELVSGKTIDKEKEGYIHLIGFALLLLLMIAITFLDISKLIS